MDQMKDYLIKFYNAKNRSEYVDKYINILQDEEIKKICMIEEENSGEIKRFSPPKAEEPYHSSDEEDN